MVETAFGCALGALVPAAYALAGYPLLAACLPRRSRPLVAPAVWPSVTLIVPAYNEEAVLERKLHNALALEYPGRLEVLVACDGCSDRSSEIAWGFVSAGVRLLDFPRRRGKASLLNDAAAVATGDVLCLCDANVYFRPDALTRLVSRLTEPGVGAVTGEVTLASHESNFGRGESAYYALERRIQQAESDWGTLMGVDGGMYVLRREHFRTLPADTILDDFTTSMNVLRQGLRIAYEPTARADENGTPTGGQEFRRRVRLGLGTMQVLLRGYVPPLSRPVWWLQFVSHKLLRWLGPCLLLIGLLAAGTAALGGNDPLRRPLAGILCGGALLLLAAAGAATYSLRFRDTRIGGAAYFFVLGQTAQLWGQLKGLWVRPQATWQRTPRGPADVATHSRGPAETATHSRGPAETPTHSPHFGRQGRRVPQPAGGSGSRTVT